MIPPMPEGFTDYTAWDVIHWKFSENGTSTLDLLIIGWQLENQERCQAAARAAAQAREEAEIQESIKSIDEVFSKIEVDPNRDRGWS